MLAFLHQLEIVRYLIVGAIVTLADVALFALLTGGTIKLPRIPANVIVINNGHRDFVFASRTKVLKLRYISRLFAKELVLKNFAGMPPDSLLERLIELGLYMEENLK